MFMSKSILSFSCECHDSNLSVYVNNQLHTIELERIYGNRYLAFQACSAAEQQSLLISLKQILKDKGLLSPFFDVGLFCWESTEETVQKFCEIFNITKVYHNDVDGSWPLKDND